MARTLAIVFTFSPWTLYVFPVDSALLSESSPAMERNDRCVSR